MTQAAPSHRRDVKHPRADFAEMFTPKLVTVFREGYTLGNFRADAIAGLTVAIVALPLSMAIAIGSGAKPEHGLIASVVAGFIISALGGSRFQIGGPAGAFIVLVAAIIGQHGYQGFLAATIMGGFILLALGYLRLGTYIKYIPHPVTVGFTAGIAVIIFAGEIKDFFGLRLEHEPSALIPRLRALAGALDTVNWHATGIGLACLAIILGLRRVAPRFPGMLVAVGFGAFVTWAFALPVETIGTKFGGIPRTLPAPGLPDISLSQIVDLIPAAIAIAILGGIESLLSAVVADGMSGRRHRSNCELVAQGWANIGSALFGGLCATGTIARTATNIRAHAHGPVAGILHAAFLLAFMFLAAPLAAWIPLAALAAVLAIVAWNMVEKEHFAAILRTSPGEATVLMATFLVTVLRDLTEGIAVGVVLGSVLFMHRMAQLVEVTTRTSIIEEDQPDGSPAERTAYEPQNGGEIVVYRISGPFFFGAASQVSLVMEQIGKPPKAYVLDLSGVPLADQTAAHTIMAFAKKASRSGARVMIAGAPRGVARTLRKAGLNRTFVDYASSVDEARARYERRNAKLEAAAP
ncbi:MAG: SulP family inorganic anion transporter [Beijerinckiaceae bacterium]|nr:SulP family inorganic anion transporter [Beijerinckiaceae bacterium]